MPTISDIQFKRRRPERFVITWDTGEETVVSPEIALKYQFGIGKHLEEQQLAEILFEDEIRRGKDQLLRYLEIRPHSRRELWKKALAKGFQSAPINQALDDLEAVGLVNDPQFARQFVQDELRLRPCGPQLMREKLRSRGIAADIVEELLEEAYQNIALYEIAARIAAKFARLHRTAPPQKLREKLSRHLISKGFSWDTISEVLSNLHEFKESE